MLLTLHPLASYKCASDDDDDDDDDILHLHDSGYC